MNHAEGDHSGALPYLMSRLPNAKIFTNQICSDTLKILYPELDPQRFEIVDASTVLSTGKHEL